MVSTNALELGIDIGHLDVAVLAGYPGTIASMWQQAGRAGRRTGESAAVMVATSSPLDQYLAAHPDYLFGAPPEHARINPGQPVHPGQPPQVRGLRAAVRGRTRRFGGSTCRRDLAALEDEGRAPPRGRAASTGPRRPIPPTTSRCAPSPPTTSWCIDTTAARRQAGQAAADHRRGRLGERLRHDPSRRRSTWSRAMPFEVQELHYREDEEKVAYVKRVDVDYFTDAISAKGVWILRRLEAARSARPASPSRARCWWPRRSSASRRSSIGTLENVGSGEVELPQQEMQTTSVWLTVPPRRCCARDLAAPRRADRRPARASPICSTTWRRIFLLCDIRDLGSWLGDAHAGRGGRGGDARVGQARLLQAERFTPTIYLYDSHAGRHRPRRADLRGAARSPARAACETLEACACRCGCPSCVGPVNEVGRRAKPTAARAPHARSSPERVMPTRPSTTSAGSSAASRRARPTAAAPAEPVEQVVDGELLEDTGRATLLVVRREFPLAHRHGAEPLRRRDRAAPLELLARAARVDGDLGDAGACSSSTPRRPGWPAAPAPTRSWSARRSSTATRFEVRQFFMRDLDEEPALLAALEPLFRDVDGRRHLQRRRASTCRCSRRASSLARRRWPAALTNLDLLRPARRVWTGWLADCRLPHHRERGARPRCATTMFRAA